MNDNKINNELFEELEILTLVGNIDDEIIEGKIDKSFEEKGVEFNMDNIKDKAMDKINENKSNKRKFKKSPFVVAAVACTVIVSSVYAGDISNAFKTLFNKTVIENSVYDGDVYFLENNFEIEGGKITELKVAEGKLDMNLILDSMDNIDSGVKIIPNDNTGYVYEVGGYGGYDGEVSLSFMNMKEENYNIKPFESCKFELAGKTYDLMLTKGEKVSLEDNYVQGENDATVDDGLVEVFAKTERVGDTTKATFLAAFNEKELQLQLFGKREKSSGHSFENDKNGVFSAGKGSVQQDIYAKDADGNSYILNPKGDKFPLINFEIDNPENKELTANVEGVSAMYKSDDKLNITLEIPESGEISPNKEVDLWVQKANIKTVKRTADDAIEIEYELNTGDYKSVSIIDLGVYSSDVIKCDTVVEGNKAVSTIKFDSSLEEINLQYSWPTFHIEGNFEVPLAN